MTKHTSCLYRGTIMHHRKRPVSHRFVYQVFSLFIDLDGLPALDRKFWLLKFERPWILSFYNKDHGRRDGSPLRPWVDECLRSAGIDMVPAQVMLLAMPRIFGIGFNPLSIYYCFDQDAQLRGIVYEVKNTFGGQHIYVLPVNGEGQFDHDCRKAFFVSPFIEMGGTYHFKGKEPSNRLKLVIRETDELGCFFVASHTGQRRKLGDRELAACLIRNLVMSLKVIVGIHWEALRLWLKGAPYFSQKAG